MINISQVNSQVFIKQRKPQCSSLKMRYKERERAWNDRIIKSEQILHLRTKESLNKKRLPKLQNTTAIIVQKYINMQKNQQESIEIVECEQKIVETKLDQLRQLYKVYQSIQYNIRSILKQKSSCGRGTKSNEQKISPNTALYVCNYSQRELFQISFCFVKTELNSN
ncbi:unnamed protein product [Paramecium pentaurelia]|uniref:Uncharacterized protein n=1 Tax=Paramecium pentaurelia TaxID=43138 RepID=A0A8S1Y3D4_9CILI|nr:unnamed protein product [Paramecium pentaurelia]